MENGLDPKNSDIKGLRCICISDPSFLCRRYYQSSLWNSVTFYYAPNFEKVDGAYCFWSVRAWVRASHFLYLL